MAGEVDFSTGGAPRPDSLFREYFFRFPRAELPVLDPGATHSMVEGIRRNPRCGSPIAIEVDDLRDATGAEAVVEFWGGHLGTSNQGFHLNGKTWYPLPQPVGTPTVPQAYYRTLLGGGAIRLDLDHLRQGPNELLFTAGPQVAHNFNFGFYWVYAVTLRIYYELGSKPHPAVEMLWPAAGQTVGETFTPAVKAREGFTSIKQVDFVSRYEDFPWSGNGIYEQWHVQYHWGQWRRHVGSTDHTVTDEPLSCTWDTTWVPDQPKPIAMMARVTSLDGICATTPAVEDIQFRRNWRSVRMCKPQGVPEAFGVRVGQRKSCWFDVPELQNLTGARLVLSTWSAAHADEIALNGHVLCRRIGRVHDHSFDRIPVPPDLLRKGRNEFSIYAETEHHMAEVNWPGPVLLLEYRL